MSEQQSALESGLSVIRQEAEAVRKMADRLDESFTRAVELIVSCRGRIIFTGIGKSGHIARKLAATFTSTGAPAFFLHPAEGVHGDLGMLQKDDLFVAVSKSGSTAELEMIFPSVSRLGVKSILLTGYTKSSLSSRVDVTLDCAVESEACPHNLAPTTSATCAMVMGHALAIATLHKRGFSSEDFANLHPAGSLGQRLLLYVRDKMHSGKAIPLVEPTRPVRETIFEITDKRLGCALVGDSQGVLLGIFTDGDLRRLTQRDEDFLDLPTSEGMTSDPQTISPEVRLDKALAQMEKSAITVLPVVNEKKKICGVLHLHDILGGNSPDNGQ